MKTLLSGRRQRQVKKIMELIDTHCHLTFEQLAGDVAGVLERSVAAGVTGWITVGTDVSESQKAIALANKYDNMYATAGIHPHYAKDVSTETIEQLREAAHNEKVVAIGEAGLDFHYNFSKQLAQKQVFIEQLKIAADLDLPLIVHSREAFDETIEILDDFGAAIEKVVFHCFGGSAEQAKIVLDRGYYISFTGVVTFKNADDARRAAAAVPVDRLMVETDCPYMSPAPMRKQKTNEPGLMVHTAKLLAEVKNVDLETLAAATTATAKEFFGLSGFGGTNNNSI